MNRLTFLANRYQTDKGTQCGACHGYTEIYDRYFQDIRDRVERPRILEIGVLDGASLAMLNEYFDYHCDIVAFDIEDKTQYMSENVTIYKGDQSDNVFLSWLTDCYQNAKFDIILDDGSHFWRHQLISFYYLSHALADNGIYIIEDIFTSDIRDGVCDENNQNVTFDDTPMSFLTTPKHTKFLTEEQNIELKNRLNDVNIYQHRNDLVKYSIWTHDWSKTAIITLN